MTKKSFLLGIIALMTINGAALKAQVGINTENPNPLTVLDVRSHVTSAGDTVFAGITIPMMTEGQRNSIDVSSNANSLLIYNLTESCYNYFMASENEWRSLCGALGKAEFEISCDYATVVGDYIESLEMTASNYLRLQVNVTKKGTYTIIASSSQTNGYSFVASGIFTNTGIQIVNIPAQGTPGNVQTDNFVITGGKNISDCHKNIEVQPNIADYSLDCSTFIVKGNYLKGTPLTTDNFIQVRVNVSTTGFYKISTPRITNGIRFEASGNFTTVGSQVITLYGSGSPTINSDFNVDIETNSQSGNNQCTALINVILPAMTYACIGNGNTYSWAQGSVRNMAFTGNDGAFGLNGLVKIVSLTPKWTQTTVASAITNLQNGSKPDIILYFGYGTTWDQILAGLLQKYVKSGGVLIYGTIDNEVTNTQSLLDGIFGVGAAIASNTPSSSDNNFLINSLPDDPIINGPFGNLGGKYWGEDNGGTIYVTKMPNNSVQVCSANNRHQKQSVNPNASVVWYNNSLNFMYFGDSTGAANNTNTSTVDYPTIIDSHTKLPVSKLYGLWNGATFGIYNGNMNNSQYIYNSALEFNAIAWGLHKAAENGINPH